MPVFDEIKDCLFITDFIVDKMSINKDILKDEKYKYLFSVEMVNKMVQEGVPFRDAYKRVGLEIEDGDYQPDTSVNHTHAGSIGNLCNDKIQGLMNEVLDAFDFEKVEKAEANLLGR